MTLQIMEWEWQPNTISSRHIVDALKQIAVLAGWSLLDPGVMAPATGTLTSWCVVTKNFSAGPFNDETAYVKIKAEISGGKYYVTLGTYSSWNATTHTGTDLVSTSDSYSYGPSCDPTQSGTLLAAVDENFFWISGRNNLAVWDSIQVGVFSCDRFPWDLLDLSAVPYKTNRVFHTRNMVYSGFNTPILGGVSSTVSYLKFVTALSYQSVNNITLLSDAYMYNDNGHHSQLSTGYQSYNFGKCRSIKATAVIGKDNVSMTRGMLLPSAIAPEYLVVYVQTQAYALLIPWRIPNFSYSIV